MHSFIKRKRKNKLYLMMACCFCIFSVAIAGVVLQNKNLPGLFGQELGKAWCHGVVSFYMPCMSYDESSESVFEQILGKLFPAAAYGAELESYQTEIESDLSYEMILAREAADENYIDPGTGQLVGETQDADAGSNDQTGTGSLDENMVVTGAAMTGSQRVVTYSLDKLADFDYLIQNFYQVDKTTTINSSQLNAAAMLEKSMTLTHDASTPQILIYHTHSQEGYTDSISGDPSTSVVGVGDYLTEILTEQYGLNVIHDTGEYDVGDRDHAYSKAGPAVEQILAENPSIEIVIDLHRDGVGENTRLVTNMNGTEMAQIMFFNGLSRTTALGDIGYLENPYISDNLAFSFQMQLTAAEYYPGFTRNIYLKGYRYNMHFCPKTLLIEVGAQTNTLQEAKNAMVPLADVLNKVIIGAK